jgi:hypothetical protein
VQWNELADCAPRVANRPRLVAFVLLIVAWALILTTRRHRH